MPGPDIKPLENESVDDYCKRLVGIAQTHKIDITGNFYGLRLQVTPNSDPAELKSKLMVTA